MGSHRPETMRCAPDVPASMSQAWPDREQSGSRGLRWRKARPPRCGFGNPGRSPHTRGSRCFPIQTRHEFRPPQPARSEPGFQPLSLQRSRKHGFAPIAHDWLRRCTGRRGRPFDRDGLHCPSRSGRCCPRGAPLCCRQDGARGSSPRHAMTRARRAASRSISASADWAHRADGRRTAVKGRNSRRFVNLASVGRVRSLALRSAGIYRACGSLQTSRSGGDDA